MKKAIICASLLAILGLSITDSSALRPVRSSSRIDPSLAACSPAREVSFNLACAMWRILDRMRIKDLGILMMVAPFYTRMRVKGAR